MNRKSLEAVLECPICLQLPLCRKIYLCQNGHNICTDCYERLQGSSSPRLPGANKVSSEIRCFFENLAMDYFTFFLTFILRTNFRKEQQISNHDKEDFNNEFHSFVLTFKVVKCPQGGCAYADTPTRNRTAELLLERRKAPFPWR